MKFQYMLGAYVWVRLLDAPTHSETGKLFLPESAKADRQRARVLKLGPKAWIQGGVEEGDVVLLESYAGEEVAPGELVVHAENIIGVWG